MMRRPEIFICLVVVICAYDFDFDIYVNEGESVLLPCKNETPPGRYYGIVWKSYLELYNYMPRGGLKIKKIAGRFRLVNETSLQLFNVTLDDAGPYECNLLYFPVNLTFNTHIPWVVMPSYLNLIVIGRPIITSLTPAVQYPVNDGLAVLKCEFLGIPYANISWNFERRRDLTEKSARVSNTSILILRRLKKRDTGFYYCVAYNSAGKTEKKAFIKVKYRPRMRIATPNPRINVGKTGTITCRAKGFPVPDMFWNFQTAEKEFNLKPLHKYRDKFSISLTRVGHAEDWAESVLTIKSLEVQDWNNNYTCVARNSQGSVDKVVHVHGFEMPEGPYLSVSEEATHSALLRWSIPKDGGSRITAYVVQFRGSFETRWMSRELSPANIQSYYIMELQPNSTYICRVAARNEVGLGAFSLTNHFTTRAEKILGVREHGTSAPNSLGFPQTRDESGTSQQDKIVAIFILSGCVLIAIILFASCRYLVGKPQKPANSHQTAALISTSANGPLAQQQQQQQQEGGQPSELASQTESVPLIESADHWEFPRSRLRLTTVIGDGAFGTVMLGVAQGIRISSENEIVAVKIARDSDSEIARKDLNAELNMLKLLPEHPNVVAFLGCCTRGETPLIIVEYCAHGDLQGFLRNCRGVSESYYKSNFKQFEQKMTSKMLVNFALQVSTGMSYLAAFKIIHRDLAARNILVDKDLVCKINDFGLARDVYVEDQYVRKNQGGRFPVKWMALESINFGISTQKSDVWSFGVLLWEIITLGASPYPGLNTHELVSFLQDGYRMEKPKHCSNELFYRYKVSQCLQIERSDSERETDGEASDKEDA